MADRTITVKLDPSMPEDKYAKLANVIWAVASSYDDFVGVHQDSKADPKYQRVVRQGRRPEPLELRAWQLSVTTPRYSVPPTWRADVRRDWGRPSCNQWAEWPDLLRRKLIDDLPSMVSQAPSVAFVMEAHPTNRHRAVSRIANGLEWP
jgi:hypothetical protein